MNDGEFALTTGQTHDFTSGIFGAVPRTRLDVKNVPDTEKNLPAIILYYPRDVAYSL